MDARPVLHILFPLKRIANRGVLFEVNELIDAIALGMSRYSTGFVFINATH